MNTANPEPLRILDVPDADGSPGPDSWALISQIHPLALCDAAGEAKWSNKRVNALLLPFDEAVALAQQRTASGDRVALVRNNAASWDWLMLVADWVDASFLE